MPFTATVLTIQWKCFENLIGFCRGGKKKCFKVLTFREVAHPAPQLSSLCAIVCFPPVTNENALIKTYSGKRDNA